VDPLRRIKGFLQLGTGRDTAVLLSSLLVAFVIWLISNLSQSYAGTLSVPVIAECNIEGHASVSDSPAMAIARCHASGSALLKNRNRSGRKPVRVSIDRSDLRQTGPEEFCLTGSAMNAYVNAIFGSGATVDAFISDSLFFRFPYMNNRKVPVELVQDLRFRDEYMLTAPLSVVPDSITVYGEEARIGGIDRVYTSALNLYDLHESQSGTLRLGRIKGVRFSQDEVAYSIDISRYVEIASTVQIEVWNAPAGKNLQVYPSTAEVVFRCKFPLRRDPSDAFRLYVDYRDFTSSLTGRCVPRILKLPSGVIDVRVTPEVVDCVLEEQ